MGLLRPRRPTLFRRVPGPRFPAPFDYPLVNDEQRAGAPLLQAEVAELDAIIVERFRKLDHKSLRAQHRFRFGSVLVIAGGAAATALGAVQAAVGGGNAAIGIAEAVFAAMVAGIAVYVRGRRFQEAYFTARVTAELVKSQYYMFLARAGQYAAPDDAERLKLLRRRLDALERAGSG